DVEQVVDEPSQLGGLAFDDFPSLLANARIGARLGTQQLGRVHDRSKRIAQLVREHGEKLVLAAIRLAQRPLEPLSAGDVDGDALQAARAAAVARDMDAGLKPHLPTVYRHAAMLATLVRPGRERPLQPPRELLTILGVNAFAPEACIL